MLDAPTLQEGVDRIYPADGKPSYDYFDNKEGLRLCGYKWEAENPKAILIAVHGIQSHCRHEFLRHDMSQEGGGQSEQKESNAPIRHPEGRIICDEPTSGVCIYEGSWVELFNQKGITVCGFDLQGHGLSDGWKHAPCNVNRFEDFARDTIQYIGVVLNGLLKNYKTKEGDAIPFESNCYKDISIPANLRAVVPDFPPVYLMGLSMGSAVCLQAIEIMLNEKHNYLAESATHGIVSCSIKVEEPKKTRNTILTGYIGLASMLAVKARKQFINKMLLKISTPLALYFPFLLVGNVERNPLYPIVDKAKTEDPLVAFPCKVAARIAVECIKAVDHLQETADIMGTDLPLLFVHSENDTLCEIEGTERYFKSLTNCREKTFWKLDSLWHCLPNEDTDQTLGLSLCNWMLGGSFSVNQATKESISASAKL